MADLTRVKTPHDGSACALWRWTNITSGQAGTPVVCAAWQDKSVQFLGMDGNGVTAPTGPGGGVVNCQFGANAWERFKLVVVA